MFLNRLALNLSQHNEIALSFRIQVGFSTNEMPANIEQEIGRKIH